MCGGDRVSLRRLHHVAAILAERDPSLGDWFRGGVARVERGLEADLAFELKGPGAIKHRNNLLTLAAALIGEGGSYSKAVDLARRLRRLRSGRQSTDMIDRLLEEADECARCPGVRRLYDILTATCPVEVAV